MSGRNDAELRLALRKRDVETALAVACAFEQELQGKRGLAGAGLALDEVHPVRVQAAGEHVIQPGYSGRRRGELLNALFLGGGSAFHAKTSHRWRKTS